MKRKQNLCPGSNIVFRAAKLGNICLLNNVSATMFPSLARPLKQKHFLVSEQQNLFLQHVFPARLNWETFASATMLYASDGTYA